MNLARRDQLCGYIVDEQEAVLFGRSAVELFLQTPDGKTAIVVVFMEDYFYVQVDDRRAEDTVRSVLMDDANFRKSRCRTVKVFDCRSVYGYQSNPGTYIQVFTNSTFDTRRLCKLLVDTIKDVRLFESNVDYLSKFNTASGVSGCSFVRISKFRTPSLAIKKRYVADAYECTLEDVRLDLDAPFFSARMFYYDIECLSLEKDVFPTADTCPIIQISYMYDDEVHSERGVLCVGDTPGYESFETELQMLKKFVQKIAQLDPDVLCGYNSNAFDMPYILDRMSIYKVEALFGRTVDRPVSYKKEKRESAQHGARWFYKYEMRGRIMMDVCDVLRAGSTTKLASYTLKNVCSVYLDNNNNKDDIRYRDIPDLMKSPEGRSRIAKYCLQDSVLVYELNQKLMIALNTWTLTRALGTVPRDTLHRGLVFKLMSKLKQYTTRYKFLIPALQDSQRPAFDKYPGAIVLEPTKGLYTDPVVVLDFESLYPSEMRSANLSFDTLVTDKKWMAENPDAWIEQIGVDGDGRPMSSGHVFVKKSVRLGLLPRMQEELGAERAAAKKKMKSAAAGSREKFVYDGLQQAAKIVMNSLYGMLGSATATIPMVEVASTITALGRKHLLTSKRFVEDHYERLTGSMEPARVIYGDTDSIFILMPNTSTELAIERGRILERAIREELYRELPPMNMQYEKVLQPFLITRKKGYSGRMLKNGDDTWRVSTTGFANVKRDTAKVGVDILSRFLDLIMAGDTAGAKAVVVETIRALFVGNLDISNFTLTKKIAKHPDAYKTVPPHVTAWHAMRKRVGPEAPAVGEMFDYVVIGNGLRDIRYIDLMRFTEVNSIHDLNVDYYFTRAIVSPLEEPLTAVYGEAEGRAMLDKSRYTVVKRLAGNLFDVWNLPAVTITIGPTRESQRTPGIAATTSVSFEPGSMTLIDRPTPPPAQKAKKKVGVQPDGWKATHIEVKRRKI